MNRYTSNTYQIEKRGAPDFLRDELLLNGAKGVLERGGCLKTLKETGTEKMNKANRIWKEIEKAGIPCDKTGCDFCNETSDSEPFVFKTDFEKVLPIIEKKVLLKPCVWENDGGIGKSQCGYADHSAGWRYYNFCPYCGGKIIEPTKGE